MTLKNALVNGVRKKKKHGFQWHIYPQLYLQRDVLHGEIIIRIQLKRITCFCWGIQIIHYKFLFYTYFIPYTGKYHVFLIWMV